MNNHQQKRSRQNDVRSELTASMACSYLAVLVRHLGEAVLKQLPAIALFHEAFTDEPADEQHEQLGVRHQGPGELLHNSCQPAPCNVKGIIV